MADVVFIQRSWTGRRIFQLRDRTLTVSGEYFGRKTIQEIPVNSIDADYQRQARRFSLLIIIPLVLAACCLLLAVRIFIVENEVFSALAMYPSIFAVSFVVAAFRGVRRTDFFVFCDQWKRPIFSIVRDPKQAGEFDSFLHELLDCIERTERGLPAAIASPIVPAAVSAVTLPSSEDSDGSAPKVSRWRASVIAGAVSAGFPWLPKVIPLLDSLVLPVVLLASIGGLWWGIASFMEREPRRTWAILGMVLSLVAPLFY